MDFDVIDTLQPLYTTSKAAVARRKSKRKPKGGKAGNQGVFHGARLDFLGSHLQAFIRLKGTARSQQKAFWQNLYGLYWAKFPWYVPLDKEPEDGDWSEPDLDLQENHELKSKTIELTQARIQTHMRYCRQVSLRANKDIWEPLFNDLRDLAKPHVTICTMANWQLYMSKKADVIREEFDARWPSAGLPPTQSIAFRGSIAHELLAKESDEYRDSLEREIEDMHSAAKEVPEVCLPEPDEEDKQAAQDQIAEVVQPLLEVLRERTGYYLTLFVGIPNVTGPREFKLKLVVAGKTDEEVPMAWHESEGARFKTDVMSSFTRFLSRTAEYKECLELSKDGSGSSTQPRPPRQPDIAVAGNSTGTRTSATAAAGSLPAKKSQPRQTGKNGGRGSKKGQASRKGKALQKSKATEKTRKKRHDMLDESDSPSSSEDESTSSFSGYGSSSGEDLEEERDDEETVSRQDPGPVDMTRIPQEAEMPSAEELGMGSVIAEGLAHLSSDERRRHLRRFLDLSMCDRESLRRDAESAAQQTNGAPISISSLLARANIGTARASQRMPAASPAHELRRSARNQAQQAAAAAPPSVETTAPPSVDAAAPMSVDVAAPPSVETTETRAIDASALPSLVFAMIIL
ncbi:hypothetical protein FKP32DRAFT_1671251 [Trametes sanguinea]|nr:hypothetical protein FKP32DRAFT_1671251 [Trametes sanguinea]